MKRCPLSMPNPMADYLANHKLDDRTKMLSYCMMLYPLMREGKLTHKQVARLLKLEEEDVDFIYDYYELPHRYARTKDFEASEERVNQAFRANYGKGQEYAG